MRSTQCAASHPSALNIEVANAACLVFRRVERPSGIATKRLGTARFHSQENSMLVVKPLCGVGNGSSMLHVPLGQ
jgi:hypothetical protein